MPYAAKAIIEHAYSAGTLEIYLTFRFPMNIKIKPSDTIWLVKLDGTVTAITSSIWNDEYTMLLTITGLGGKPAVVKVKFDGPDSNLETTWHKNWEPWGYSYSSDLSQDNVPSGVILMWHGTIATIPAGWLLCNGSSGTPDLRNKFIVGATQDSSGIAKTNVSGSLTQTGGVKDHVHALYGPPMADITGGANWVTSMQTVQHLPPYYALAFIMKS